MNSKTTMTFPRTILALICLASGLMQVSAQTLAEQYRSLWTEAQQAYEQEIGRGARRTGEQMAGDASSCE